MRRFQLIREKDCTGVSGTGVVAEGVEFTTGKVAMTWKSHYASLVIYDNIKVLQAIHNHEGTVNEGGTTVKWLD